MRHYRQCIIVMFSLLSTWCRDTCSWPWLKITSRRLHLEQILGDQQFVTLLLYLNDICIFAPDVSAMVDQIELVFSQLKAFNLKLS